MGLAWKLAWPWRAAMDKARPPGAVLPDFELADGGGRRHRLSDDGGRRTLLWLTNLCDGCQARAPLLNELAERHGPLVRVLAVNLLAEEETARKVAPKLRFPLLLDPEDVVQRVLGIPHPPGSCPLHNLYLLAPGRAVLWRGHLSAMKPAAVSALAEL